jgi:nucleotide-binding universal stress UspA family protein
MYRQILVPLDGSRSAEAALPVAAYLAGRLGAAITLFHALERDAPDQVHGERHLTTVAEAEVYLVQAEERWLGAGESTTARHVHEAGIGDVAGCIVDHGRELGADLIVMCTHGRSGPRHWVWGSLAQQVLARDGAHVLLLRPPASPAEAKYELRHVLVPLDGAAMHEEGLWAAAELAKPCAADLRLLSVVPTRGSLSGDQAAAGKLLPSAMKEILDVAEQSAADYLADLSKALEARGLPTSREVRRGDPAEEIAESAQSRPVDLIALATHARAGIEAFWTRSVGPRVSARTRTPLLLVPVRDTPLKEGNLTSPAGV